MSCFDVKSERLVQDDSWGYGDDYDCGRYDSGHYQASKDFTAIKEYYSQHEYDNFLSCL